jgi:hypothetical protein
MKRSLFESTFNPSKWKRPSRLDLVSYHIAVGDSGVGKTTLFYQGWRELSEVGIYARADLNVLGEVEPSQNFSRFSIPRRQCGFFRVDSWIDGEGEKFQEFCSTAAQWGDGPKESAEVQKVLTKCSAGITVVVPAAVLEWNQAGLEKSCVPICKLINEFVFATGCFGRNRKCNLIISQAGDILPPKGKVLSNKLKDKVRTILEKSTLEHHCEHALVVDSLANDPIGVCRLSKEGRKIVLKNSDARMCSAGTALAIVMGVIPKKGADEWGFTVSTKPE